jgi:hypothetical protein
MASTTNREKMGSMGSAVAEKAEETAGTFGEAARNVASNVAQKAGEAASFVGKKAEDATAAVGGGMKSLAGTIRDKGPHEGVLGSAGSTVADTLESGGRYLEKYGLSGVGEDLTNIVRRNPVPSVLVCIGLGFLLARAMRS